MCCVVNNLTHKWTELARLFCSTTIVVAVVAWNMCVLMHFQRWHASFPPEWREIMNKNVIDKNIIFIFCWCYWWIWWLFLFFPIYFYLSFLSSVIYAFAFIFFVWAVAMFWKYFVVVLRCENGIVDGFKFWQMEYLLRFKLILILHTYTCTFIWRTVGDFFLYISLFLSLPVFFCLFESRRLLHNIIVGSIWEWQTVD